MPDITTAAPGHFCWFELSTADQPAAKQFYSSLFGWTCNDQPMGPDSFYTMFQWRGRDIGACCTMQPDQRAQGIPPYWMTYVAVASVDDTVAKAAELGGQALMPGFDVFDAGRLAILQDPTGAIISVWQAKAHQGAGVMYELNTFGWCDLLTNDTAAATKFYTGLFGWETMVSDSAGFAYTHWRLGGTDFGGMLAIRPEMGPIPPHWLNYLSVANCDECAAKATSLGGKIACPPTDIPNVGRFAVLRDPQGGTFAIIALVPMHK
jgi:predicted enzyme related to lactoylglutathione lyase